MIHYTVHDPVTHMKANEFGRLEDALEFAYTYLPLDTPGQYHPEGKYVIVQEWDGNIDPLRQWIISGRCPEAATTEPE